MVDLRRACLILAMHRHTAGGIGELAAVQTDTSTASAMW